MENYNSQPDMGSIAIIGMSGRFPKADTIEKFWGKLKDGEECISFFSDEELEIAENKKNVLKNPNYVKAAGVLEGIDLFDAAFFGFTPREAEITSPQHRLFLECGYEALEKAGYNTDKYQGRIGVYAGESSNTYMLNIFSNRKISGITTGNKYPLGMKKILSLQSFAINSI